MLYRKEGMPVVNEIVLCKVTKIYPNSVFVEMLEYNRKSGLIHISEVSPGRIRNLRDYVSINRQIVCKILRINSENGFIDLSLRRVNSNQRREKLEEIKSEIKSEQLIKTLSKRIDQPFMDLYNDISKKVFEEYSHLHLCFKDVSTDDADLAKLGVDKKTAGILTEMIKDKFKPQKIKIEGEITLSTYSSDGVEKIKETLIKVEKVSETISIHYLGAGRFKLIIEDFEYKPAEKNLKKVQELLKKFDKDKLSTAIFDRKKKE